MYLYFRHQEIENSGVDRLKELSTKTGDTNVICERDPVVLGEDAFDVAMPGGEGHLSGPCDHVNTWPSARLSGLRTVELNGKVGSIISFDDPTQRCGFLIHGDPEPKAIKPANLIPYRHSNDDVCRLCSEPINFCSFPPCGCIMPDFAAPSGDITGESKVPPRTASSSSSEGAPTRP